MFITINHDKVEADLVNFPLMINVPSEYLSHLGANFRKLFVKTEDGEELYWTPFRWDDEVKMIHVNLPFLSSTEDTTLYLEYNEGINDSHYVCLTNQELQKVWIDFHVVIQEDNKVRKVYVEGESEPLITV